MTYAWIRVGIVVLAVGAAGSAAASDLAKRLKDPDDEVRSAAIREVRDAPTFQGIRLVFPMLDDRKPYVRDLTWSVLAGIKNPEWIRWMAGAARTDRGPRIRRAAADVFGRGRASAAYAYLKSLLRDRDPVMRATAADALGRLEGVPEAAEAVRSCLSDRDVRVRAAGLEALSRLDPEGAVSSLRAALTDDDEGVRCVALRSLRYGNRDLAVEAGAWALLEGGWRLRAQAIENTLWLKERRVVEGLVGAGRRVKRARIRADLFAALRRLTGLEIPPVPGDWEAWWEEHGAAWREGGKIKRSTKPDPASSSARYYGIPVQSGRLTFLLDGSGSMREPMSAKDGRTKMGAARDELLKTLAMLPPSVRLNVIVFDEEPRAFKPALVPLTSRNRKKLESFLRPYTGRGRTNVHETLLLALADEDVDTVFILSDGAPSVGEYIFRSRVLERVRRINRRRKVAIHTIAFAGRKIDRDFLRDLAVRNGGTSVVSARK